MTKPFLTNLRTAGFLAILLSSAAAMAAPLGNMPATGSATDSHQMMPVQMRMGPMGGPGQPGMGGAERMDRAERVDRVEGRIAFLKAELKITEAQAKQWEAVAKAMRDQSAALKALSEQRPQHDQTERDRSLSVPEILTRNDAALAWQTQVLAARSAGQKQFAAAFVPLYNQMSDDQKKTADSLLTRHGRGHRS